MTTDRPDDRADEAARLIRPLVATVEGCAIDGGYVSHVGDADLAERIIAALSAAGLLATPADQDNAAEVDWQAIADQAEQDMADWVRNCGDAEGRAELAEAEVSRLRAERCSHNKCPGVSLCCCQPAEKVAELLAERNELHAEVTRLRLDVSVTCGERDQLRAQVAQRDALIRDLADPDPCWFDHHGGCQAHGYLSLQPGDTCPQYDAQQIVAALGTAGGGQHGE